MKKLFFLVALFFIYGVSAQSIIELNPDFRPVEGNTFVPASRDAQDLTVTWLEDEEEANSLGASNFAPFMEFTTEDIINFTSSGRSLKKVKQINFHLSTSYTGVTSCQLKIMQGSSFASATEVYSQDVTVSGLTSGWNNVNLTTPYTIDSSQNLYIGYRMVHSSGTYPASVAGGEEPKQAWYRTYSGSTENNFNLTSSYDLVFMIKALVETEDTPENEISLQSVNMDRYFVIGDQAHIEGTIKNMGTAAITSFDVTYDINGTETNESYIGLNILPNTTYDFTSNLIHNFAQVENYHFTVTVSSPNGIDDIEFNNSKQHLGIVASERAQRKILHEGFTSSTCGPCKNGNAIFKAVLQSADPDKWVCIKYQMDFPPPGDPYYTEEAGNRFAYYGLGSVPAMVVEGLYDISPYYYTLSIMDILATVPAAAKMSSQGTVTGKKLDLTVKLEPVIDFSFTENVRLFAAIVEKGTQNNVGGNGEVSFMYVMKAFMSDVNGKPVTGLTLGEESSHDFSYEFNGDYRLPRNGQPANIIKPAIEHSVENFDSLMFVYWLQDIRTGEVFQAGKFDPHPDLVNVKETEMFPVTVYPNPAMNHVNIQSDVPFSRLTLINMMGQTVRDAQASDNHYQMNLEGLTKGIYLLRIESGEGVTTKKINIQ